MFYSALLVTAQTGAMAKAREGVVEKGLDVFQEDEVGERFIAVAELETPAGAAELFRELLELPGVRDVSLVQTQEEDAAGA